MEREWRDIRGYVGLYKVSNLGEVFSYLSNKKLNPCTTKYGYNYLSLYKNKKSKSMFLHRVVAGAFLINEGNKPQINHKDGDKTNNHVDNLEWCTAKENSQHAVTTGLSKGPKGTVNGKAVLDDIKVLTIRTLINKYEGKYLAKFYGVSSENISAIKTRRSWKHI